MRRLNAKLIFGLLGTVVVLSVLLFGVHWLQQGSVARALLTRAERAENEDRPDQVVRYVSRYLELMPDDVDQRARLGTILAGERMPATAKVRTRAAMVLEQVLLRDPSRTDLRLKLARVYLQIDRLDLAEEQLKLVQAAWKDNGEVELVFGYLHEGKRSWADAAAWYRKAVQHAPQQVDGYVALAYLLRQHFAKDKERIAEADQVVDQLVEKNPVNAQAQLARWSYRKQWVGAEDALKSASGNVEQALKQAPEGADALLAASELAQLRKDPDAARKHLEAGRKLHPRDLRMHRELAFLELRQEKRDRAIEILRSGAKALKGPAKVELLWTLGNILIDGDAMKEAQTVIDQMAKSGASASSVDYLNARVEMRKSNWPEATRLLERTRPLVSSTPELASQVDLLLSECFRRLDDPAAQIGALGRLVSREPGSVNSRLALANALGAAGRTEEAFEQYRQLMAYPDAPKTGWIEIARMLVVRDVQLARGNGTGAQAKPDWKDATAALDRAAEANPDAMDVLLLRAELLMVQGKADEVRTLLKGAIEKHKEKPELWVALANLVVLPEGGNDPNEATRLLKEAQEHVGDTVEMRVAQVRFWVRRGGTEATPALKRLAQGMEKFTAGADQARLLGELAEAQFRLGNTKEATELWTRLAQLPANRNDIRLRLLLFELALQTGDESALQSGLADLQRLEGNDGTLWRYAAAARLIYRGTRGKAELEEARLLLDAVAARRPNWPPALVAQADLEAARNNPEQAIANYRRAMALGDHNPRTVRQLVELLYRQQRYEEADQEMRKLQKETSDGSDMRSLQRLAVDISLRNQDPERALRLAAQAVSAGSTDYRDHLWQGQVLAATGLQPQQAEDELRQAVKLGPKEPETWVALVQFLARQGKTAEAEAELKKARLPDDQAPLALAPCYEVLGKRKEAEEQYQKALAAKPEDVRLLRGVAAFYLRTGRLDSAEPLLRKVIDGKVKAPAAEQTWARHNLSLALATCGDYRRLPEALTLLGMSLDGNGRIKETASADSPEEQRIRARVLGTQSWREAQQKAIALLESLGRRQAPVAEDQFLLAQLYEETGAWSKAQPLYRLVSGPGSKNPTCLIRYAQGLLRRRELAEAEQCVGRLEQLEKARKLELGSFSSVELRALLLELKGQGKQALALLQDYVSRKDAKPEQAVLLINALVREKRYDDALARCEQARETCPPEMVAAVTLGVLRAARGNDEPCAALERWLQTACEKSPKSVPLWFARAGLADLRGRYDDAETFCRKTLELDERHLSALNNLAWLLALKPGKAAEALVIINRAIALAGPRGELLDTRATAQLAAGRPDLAIADLEAANLDSPDSARYFRLAQAHQQANNAKQARTLLQKATSSGLKSENLHPVEQAALRKLMDELK